MSLPCAGKSKYKVCTEEKTRASLCPGKMIEGAPKFTCDLDEPIEIVEYSSNSTILKYPLDISTEYKIAEDGILISVYGNDKLIHLLPAFAFDGESETVIKQNDNTLIIEYEGWQCKYTASGLIKDLNITARNRNGYYKLFYAESDNNLKVNIQITKQ